MEKELLQQARIAKDGDYDGRFFFGVATTGIFCRPSCPAPTAKEENVRYFATLFEALQSGYRPCLRCRPDVSLDYYGNTVNGDSVFVVETALRMIYEGFLNTHSLTDLAAEMLVSDRHLRKLFVDNLGVPPVTIAKYHRALFAKKLLLYSRRSITDIAFASGFGSLRQFNDVFKQLFGLSPSRLRALETFGKAGGSDIRLQLKYRSPFSFREVLSFLRPRAITGVEQVTDTSYGRTFRLADGSGFFEVRDQPEAGALQLTIGCDDITCYMELYARVRRMFDLDTDLSHIESHLTGDPLLAEGLKGGCVPRLPVVFSPYECVVRAILGQQVSVQAATTLAGRIVKHAALRCQTNSPHGLEYFFPEPAEVLAMNLDSLGITKTRQETLKRVSRAVLEGTLRLTANQSFDDFVERFTSFNGIGEWTAGYVGMRGLGFKDGFPASDLGIIKALSPDGAKASQSDVKKRAEIWRPYRAYAALCLWNRLKNKDMV